jgi:hypothetical protein
MNSYDAAKLEMDKIAEDAILNAYAMYAVLGLKEDDLSAREAFSLYGKAWVLDRTRRGMIHFERNGDSETSAKVYSRFEIECLKRAEKRVSDNYIAAIRRIECVRKKMV